MLLKNCFPILLLFIPSALSETSSIDVEKLGAMIADDAYTSSRVCGSCHETIYASWKRSIHSLSLEDPIFDLAFMQALKIDSEKARALCLRCHAPLTMETGDLSLKDSVTTEGVTCDFCHSVTDVVLDDKHKPYRSIVGGAKRGLLKQAESPVHEVVYSKLHGEAKFCAGCHLYTSDSGAILIGTYQEWLEGPYASEGIVCQECHMARSSGYRVNPDVKLTSPGTHLHSLIHDSEQMKKAVAVKISDVKMIANSLRVDVEITNVGSGHMIPTGIPSRHLELVVTVKGPGLKEAVSQRLVFQKTVADKDGNLLASDAETLMNGESIVSDNRIGPREVRKNSLSFIISTGGPFDVSADVIYHYASYVAERKLIKITMNSDKKTFRK